MAHIELIDPWEQPAENTYVWILEPTTSGDTVELTLQSDSDRHHRYEILHRTHPDPAYTHITAVHISTRDEIEEIMNFLASRIAQNEYTGDLTTTQDPYTHISPTSPTDKLAGLYNFLTSEYNDEYAAERNPVPEPDHTEELP